MRRRPFATVLVGPSTLLRGCLERTLCGAKFRVVASASRVEDIVLRSLPKNQPILLIVDAVDDPDAGASQIDLFKEQHPTARIAVLVERFQQNEMISAFRAGANLYFIKAANCAVFIKALELVMLGETILPAEFLSLIREHEHLDIARHSEMELSVSQEVNNSHIPRLSTREKAFSDASLKASPTNSLHAR